MKTMKCFSCIAGCFVFELLRRFAWLVGVRRLEDSESQALMDHDDGNTTGAGLIWVQCNLLVDL